MVRSVRDRCDTGTSVSDIVPCVYLDLCGADRESWDARDGEEPAWLSGDERDASGPAGEVINK